MSSMNHLRKFADALTAKADELAEYERNLERANGGGSTEGSKAASDRASIFRSIASIADQVAQLGTTNAVAGSAYAPRKGKAK